ncbi:MAG: MoaD/ThiS family protein [Bacillota bacterium]
MPAVSLRLYEPFLTLIGSREVEIEITGPTTVKDLMDCLKSRFPQLRGYFPVDRQDPSLDDYCAIVISGRIARQETIVSPGQTVIILPPNCGG